MGNVGIYGCPITEYISPHACKMTDRNSAAAVRENPVSPPLLYIIESGLIAFFVCHVTYIINNLENERIVCLFAAKNSQKCKALTKCIT